jgi:hypothetical protein
LIQKSIDSVLTKIANEDAIPYIIAEIPTNPRVEVPNLIDLKHVLVRNVKTANEVPLVIIRFIQSNILS